jgi:hypothetical protein
MCPYAVCLVADVDKRLWLKEASFPYVAFEREPGDAVNGGLGLRMPKS